MCLAVLTPVFLFSEKETLAWLTCNENVSWRMSITSAFSLAFLPNSKKVTICFILATFLHVSYSTVTWFYNGFLVISIHKCLIWSVRCSRQDGWNRSTDFWLIVFVKVVSVAHIFHLWIFKPEMVQVRLPSMTTGLDMSPEIMKKR